MTPQTLFLKILWCPNNVFSTTGAGIGKDNYNFEDFSHCQHLVDVRKMMQFANIQQFDSQKVDDTHSGLHFGSVFKTHVNPGFPGVQQERPRPCRFGHFFRWILGMSLGT